MSANLPPTINPPPPPPDDGDDVSRATTVAAAETLIDGEGGAHVRSISCFEEEENVNLDAASAADDDDFTTFTQQQELGLQQQVPVNYDRGVQIKINQDTTTTTAPLFQVSNLIEEEEFPLLVVVDSSPATSAPSQASTSCAPAFQPSYSVAAAADNTNVDTLQDKKQHVVNEVVETDDDALDLIVMGQSLPNGDLTHKQQQMTHDETLIINDATVNETLECEDSNSIAVHGSHTFQCSQVDTVLVPVSEDCASLSQGDQNISIEISTVVDVEGGTELAGGFSMVLAENQSMISHGSDLEVPQASKNEHIMPTLVEDLDRFPCTGGDLKTWDELIKVNVSSLVEEMGDALLDDLDEKSADSVRENVPDAEPVTGFDQVKGVEKECVNLNDLIPEICTSEREASYILAPEKEGEFSVSNLVWGKVKSHPWWPGQIFDSSDASERAMKYRKKGCFLVAYFGDQTFAWNEASSLNHFQTHFSQMEKQCNSEAFHTAISYTLDEVRRRVELGMVCSCTAKEVYAKVNSQVIENAGIRKEARRMDVLDNSLSVASFESGKLLQCIKTLAPCPYGGGDRMELKIAQAQLLAFYRLKGFRRLPEFHVYGGLLEEDVNSALSGERNHSEEVVEHEPLVSETGKHTESDKTKLKTRDTSSSKRKYGSDGGPHPSRKKRSLSDLMAGKKAPSYLVNTGKNGVDERGSSKRASSSGIKRKAVDSFSESAVRSMKRMPSLTRDVDIESPTPQSFKVGECIRRIASQLTGSPPILKCSGERFQKSSTKLDRGNENDGLDGSPIISEGSHRRRVSLPKEYSSPDEMLSQLCLAARDPMKGYSFLTTIVGFFSDFRNSVSLECSTSGKQKRPEKVDGGRISNGIKKTHNTETSSNNTFDFEEMSDSYWTDRIIQSSPEELPSSRSRKRKGEYQFGFPTDLYTPSFEEEDRLQLSLVVDFAEQSLDEDYVLAMEKPSRKYRKRKRKSQSVLPLDNNTALDFDLSSLGDHDLVPGEQGSRLNDNKYVNEFSPTALLMSFTESASIPSEMNLNKIFRRFGPLKESETEVLRDSSSARVVFKKQTDAEVAFSSATKFSIFGSVHVNYQLRFKV